jgi:hypothetical protein
MWQYLISSVSSVVKVFLIRAHPREVSVFLITAMPGDYERFRRLPHLPLCSFVPFVV